MARLFNARTLVLGGLAAVAYSAIKNKGGVAGLLGGGASTPEPYPSPAAASPGTAAMVRDEPAPPPVVANVDVPGPPENTATPVPAPDPLVHDPEGGIDEEAEEAAAAAEAANIGGAVPEYAGDELGDTVSEEERPLVEAGEGVAEGFEQAEAELVDNAEPAAGDPIAGERQIDDVIEAQDDPTAGEIVEAVQPAGEDDEAVPGGPADTEVHEDQLSIDSAPPSTPRPVTEDSLAAGTTEEGAATTGGTLSGLTGDPAPPPPAPTERVDAPPPQTSAQEKSSNVWRVEDTSAVGDPPSNDEQPTVEQPAAEKPDDDDDGGSEWQTWSGRAVDS